MLDEVVARCHGDLNCVDIAVRTIVGKHASGDENKARRKHLYASLPGKARNRIRKNMKSNKETLTSVSVPSPGVIPSEERSGMVQDAFQQPFRVASQNSEGDIIPPLSREEIYGSNVRW